MTPNEYQQLAMRTRCPQVTVRDRLKFAMPVDLLHAVVGMQGEVGELAAAVEKCLWYGKDLDRANVYEELGDLLWYVAEACTAMGCRMEDVMSSNLEKLKARYPERYDDKLEANRDRLKEAEALSFPRHLEG